MRGQMQQVQGVELPKPSNLEIEQQLIGRMLLEPATIAPVLVVLGRSDFAEALHARIFAAIEETTNAGNVASIFTLRADFAEDPAIKSLGNVNYFAELVALARHCLDPILWAREIKSLAFRRRLIGAARDIEDAATHAASDFKPEQLSGYAETILTSITSDATEGRRGKFEQIGDVAGRVLQSLGEKAAPNAIPFGLAALDGATGGMRPGEFIVIGARPGMGKTAVGAHIAKAAAEAGHAAAFFSMEMGAEAVTLRLLTSYAFRRYRDTGGLWAVPNDVPAYEAARRHDLAEAQILALCGHEKRLREIPLNIHDGRGLTPSGIVLSAKRLKTELKAVGLSLDLVVVDHLQKIKPERSLNGNRVGEMTETTDALQKLAGDEQIAVVALSQLSRANEKRDDKRPQLADLRESGSIEQDADMVLMLYREAYYLSKDERSRPSAKGHHEWTNEWHEKKHLLEIAITKQRNGPEGVHEVFFHAPSSWVGDL